MREDELQGLEERIHVAFLFQAVEDFSEHIGALHEFLDHTEVVGGVFRFTANR